MATWVWLLICLLGATIGVALGWVIRRNAAPDISDAELDRLRSRLRETKEDLDETRHALEQAQDAATVVDLRSDPPQSSRPPPTNGSSERSSPTEPLEARSVKGTVTLTSVPSDSEASDQSDSDTVIPIGTARTRAAARISGSADNVVDLRAPNATPVAVHNLQFLDGLGPRTDNYLRRSGVSTLAELVALDDKTLTRFDATEVFSAKRARRKWIPQARDMLERAKTTGAAEPRDLSGLREVQGIGYTMSRWLEAHGITTLEQVAELDKAKVADLQSALVDYPGRIVRERWVKQARALARS